jgi:hypothetical protein
MMQRIRILLVLSLLLSVVPPITPVLAGRQSSQAFWSSPSGPMHLKNLDKTSPDGTWVTYVTADDLSMTNAKIWISKSDGSEARVIVASDGGGYVTNPIWSPDSRQLAYV